MPLRVPKYAMSFNGVDDYAEVVLSAFPFDEFTVEMMFLDYMHSGNRYERHVGLYASDGSRMWNLYTSRFEPHSLVFEAYNTEGEWVGETLWPTPLNEWEHVTITLKNETLKVYRNASLEVTKSSISVRDLGEYYLRVGGVKTIDNAWSKIAFLRIYSRALSEEEIRHNYLFPDNPVRNGLVLWLHARPEYVSGNTWVDLSGFGNNATLNGPTLEQIIKTPKRYTLTFDGVDDYAKVPYDSSLNPDSLTVEIMFYPIEWRNPVTGYLGHWLYKGVNDYTILTGDNKITFRLRTSDGTYVNDVVYVSEKRWYHAVITFDNRTYKKRWYLDGVLKGERQLSLPLLKSANANLFIGSANSTDYAAHGYIAYVRIYNRALTQGEIRHNMEHPTNPVRDGLVLWLHADPDYISDSTWVDLSGNGNNATLYGPTLTEMRPNPLRTLTAVRKLSPTR